MNKLSLKKKKSSSKPKYKKVLALIVLLVVLGGVAAVAIFKFPVPTPPGSVKLQKAHLDEKEVTKEEKSSYQVAPDHPRALYISKIGVKEARILPMGLEKDRALAAPSGIHDVGWYQASAKPGQGSGALLLDGHVSGVGNVDGVFRHLKNLSQGDEIVVEKGDHTKITYVVKEVEIKPYQHVDMAKAMRSVEPDKEGLNIITCGGKYDYSKQVYEDRVVAYAVRSDE